MFFVGMCACAQYTPALSGWWRSRLSVSYYSAMRISVRVMWCILTLCFAVVFCVWYAVMRESRSGLLTVSFLNVGQGDAIFIDAPSGRQVLVDGGPDTSVLRQLGRVLPWHDRDIDVIIATHPDQDHVSGLVEVLDRYHVDTIVHSDVESPAPAAAAFAAAAHASDARKVLARRGERIDLGGGVTLDILSPDRSLRTADTNVACIVARLTYGKTAFLLPCDAPQAIEQYLVRLDGDALRADVLKAGHHGSKTSSSPLFVGFVDPQYVVYSRGCNNTYGHPNAETLATFVRFGVAALDTCLYGTITFISDGNTVRIQ